MICETWTGQMGGKKGRAQNNVRIIYRHFAIRLVSRIIFLSLIARENPFVSCIVTASTVKRFEMRNTRNLSREAALKKRNIL